MDGVLAVMTLTPKQIAEDEAFDTADRMQLSRLALVRALKPEAAYELLREAVDCGYWVNPWAALLTLPSDELASLLENPWEDCDGSCTRLILTANAGRPGRACPKHGGDVTVRADLPDGPRPESRHDAKAHPDGTSGASSGCTSGATRKCVNGASGDSSGAPSGAPSDGASNGTPGARPETITAHYDLSLHKASAGVGGR